MASKIQGRTVWIPNNWAIVPNYPTDEMVSVARKIYNDYPGSKRDSFWSIWAGMLHVCPPIPIREKNNG